MPMPPPPRTSQAEQMRHHLDRQADENEGWQEDADRRQ
jgi:hypothetical protein